ncbi:MULTISPECIES: carbohydrate ABC transporter permease [unclassified Saccharopolyspora]|uniref:carbohydrate ABC transporter permease n=1 Tax=unclassified Saccharopolyspora TaxID=2646250 RepID=UPI001CD2F45A|nr:MULTISPECIES: sugar ABC transporter permease [unclassified Saccharopolyspora]MCA1186155.1 sugar ABC transporter permease [Saccharopolyspora sp. 6T]MCA1193084.1 sugar ABC transporter permease [Saccharopolyspora sp. 6V]MCA1224611.1 sugar ABC transporter permease [Saccharopolyspora sp. 6M]
MPGGRALPGSRAVPGSRTLPGSRGLPGSRALPYLFLLPALVFELLVHLLPLLGGLWMSVHELDQFSLREWPSAPFAGWDNYRSAVDLGGAAGAELLRSFAVTAAFSLLVVVLSFGLGLAGAVLLQRPFRGRFLLRGLFLVPYALPVYAVALVWRFVLDRGDGAWNSVLRAAGLGGGEFWLLGPNAFASLVVVEVWRLWPFALLVLLAGLRSIPPEVHEAAEVDGAGPVRRLRSITLPLLRPVSRVLVLVLFLWSFTEFTVPHVLFGESVPAAAGLLSVHVHESAFRTWNFGSAAAMSALLLGFLLLLVAVPLLVARLRGRRAA